MLIRSLYEYNVDTKRKVVNTNRPGVMADLPYSKIVEAYDGSPSVAFLDENDNVILETGPVIGITPPQKLFTAETGNVLVRTQNSTYEIDQEQRLIRRLAGLNDPTASIGEDGEWRSYESVRLAEVGYPLMVKYGDTKYLQTSRVREIEGTFVPPVPSLIG